MDMKKTILAVVVIALLIFGGFYFFSKNTSLKAPSNSAKVDANLVLNTASDSSLGTYLVAPNGMTLYLYTKDAPGISNCYEQCAVNWPPYIVGASSPLKAASTVAGSIATTTRTDGKLQLTYNGVPLYYWIKDTKVGDTTGQNVGGVWFVVKP